MISETSPDPKFSEFVDMARLQTPQTYCCRLYVVKALNLQPKDLNGAADPYLLLKVPANQKRFHIGDSLSCALARFIRPSGLVGNLHTC